MNSQGRRLSPEGCGCVQISLSHQKPRAQQRGVSPGPSPPAWVAGADRRWLRSRVGRVSFNRADFRCFPSVVLSSWGVGVCCPHTAYGSLGSRDRQARWDCCLEDSGLHKDSRKDVWEIMARKLSFLELALLLGPCNFKLEYWLG